MKRLVLIAALCGVLALSGCAAYVGGSNDLYESQSNGVRYDPDFGLVSPAPEPSLPLP